MSPPAFSRRGWGNSVHAGTWRNIASKQGPRLRWCRDDSGHQVDSAIIGFCHWIADDRSARRLGEATREVD